jgi:hypothetical protein
MKLDILMNYKILLGLLTMGFWKKIRLSAEIPFMLTGCILTFYIAASALGWVKKLFRTLL